MKRNEIMKMPAGRKMDALIAERVFGWSWNGDFLLPPPDHPASVNHWCAKWDDAGRPHWLPNYSTEIQDALTVAEKMMRSEYKTRARFVFGFPNSLIVPERAALIICRAALLAAFA